MARGGGWSGKVTPNLAMDEASTRLLNLTVLQRLDPAVEEILITAAHVTLYDFDTNLNQWSRKDVEGSLFVVKRNSQPRFQFVVMNRRNTDNLVESLLGDFEYELQVPYIMYRNAAQEVIGIWFYNSEECEEIAKLFSRILNAFSKVSPKSKISSIKSGFEELEVEPTVSAAEDPLELPTSSTSTTTDVYDTFSAFFSAAASIGGTSCGAVAGQPNQSFGIDPSSSHALPSVIPSQSTALHPLLPFQASSVPVMPPDALHLLPSKASSVPLMPLMLMDPAVLLPRRSTSLIKPLLFSPLTSSQSSSAACSMPTAPPLHIPLTSQQPQGAPLLQLPTASPSPPYGTPLLQPFPPPNPSPSLTPMATFGPILARDKVRDALLRLVQNDTFIDMVYREIVKGQYL